MRWCVGAEGRVVRDDDAVAVWACRIEGRNDLVIEDDISFGVVQNLSGICIFC